MRLIQYLNEGISDKGIFKACFMAGHPGSGKTYSLSRIKSGAIEPRIINTDKIYEFLGTDAGLIDKTKILIKKQLILYINSMLPLAVDGTSSKPNAVLRRYGILESFGYDMAMVFINCSLATAINRVKQRDRQVPEKIIIRAHNDVMKMKAFYKGKFPKFIEINNDKGELDNELILKAFKQMTSFYTSPIANPVGVGYVRKMKAEGWKYLSPHLHDIKDITKSVSIWYKK